MRPHALRVTRRFAARLYKFLSTVAGLWPSAAKVPIRPRATVTRSAPNAAAAAGPGSHANVRFITRVTTYHAAIEPAATPNNAVVAAEQQVFQRVGADQPAARGAERLEHDGVVDAVAVAGRERAAEHQHRRDQRHQACAADRRAPGCARCRRPPRWRP